MVLEDIKFNYKLFLDKSTLIIGESSSGKSTIIKDIAHTLTPHIDQIIVISPSDIKNRSFSGYMVPAPCVHKTITDKLLNDIWQRQEALGNIYVRANNPAVLRKLFEKVANEDAKKVVKDVFSRKIQCERELKENATGDISDKLKEIDDDAKDLVHKIYKHYIGNNIHAYNKNTLTRDEKLTLQYLNLNPRLLWIFDDCTSLLTKFKKHPVIQELFYQGRWSFITLLIATHTDKVLDPEIKSNSFLKIFTQEPAARMYFKRESTGGDKTSISAALGAISEAFTPAKKFQKLVHVRGENKFYKYTADIWPDFRFGSPIIWHFCELIKADTNSIPDNKFIYKFEAQS